MYMEMLSLIAILSNVKLHHQGKLFVYFFLLILLFSSCREERNFTKIELTTNDRIVLIGNNLCSRMMNYGHFETALHLKFPDEQLFIRNMCDGGNTMGFRPHSGRPSPWAFPGAEKFYDEKTNNSNSAGHFKTPDEWLTSLKPDYLLAFFGYNESFQGFAGINNFKEELQAFIDHTSGQKYNGQSSPQLIMISPIAFEDLSAQFDVPNGVAENENLEMYTKAMKEVCLENSIPFVDVYEPTKKWVNEEGNLTIDGFQLTEDAYKRFSNYVADQIFVKGKKASNVLKEKVLASVIEKNWMWHNDYKIPNGVHVFGRRYEPFGPENYPDELTKIKEMTALRDSAIWESLAGRALDINKADAATSALSAVKTNFTPTDKEQLTYKYGDDALETFTMAPGYEIALFASEKEFPDLANPVQLSFDNKGRLWVAVMPSYPHYKPGDEKPNDKLLILEDTDGDGKADKQTIFADGLHLPVGFEFSTEGVYVSQGTNLKLLKDKDGDDHVDEIEIILSGFDDHDTHHVISAFCADPSGAIYMGEGLFLHTNVETPYGPINATNGGFFRYNPSRKHLERSAQLPIPNPWGTGFDKWGQNFFAQTSGPDFYWMMPGTIKPRYGINSPNSRNLIEEEHLVRPTSGVEFVSSRHFPDEAQGDLLINNTIGFLGTKQHKMMDSGTGYRSHHVQDLVTSTDGNFRPVDMEFAPDGSLYLVDWHNILVGHMQHNARDPLRDHVHGRIYRITYPERPLVIPPKVHDATIEELLDNLKLPEYRARYRSRRVLRTKEVAKVRSATSKWASSLDREDLEYERYLLEALWVTWGMNEIDSSILVQCLDAEDFRVRAAAVKVLRYNMDKISNGKELLMKSAADEEGRVRLETIVTASWLSPKDGSDVLSEAAKYPIDDWMERTYKYALAHLNDENPPRNDEATSSAVASGDKLATMVRGKEIYGRDGFCETCHQKNGKGLALSGYPPLTGTKWLDEELLIRLTLKGLYGPIIVLGKEYPGQVPMVPYEGMLNDREIADVLNYVRNSFGNEYPLIEPEKVAQVRALIKDKEGFYTPEELLKEVSL